MTSPVRSKRYNVNSFAKEKAEDISISFEITPSKESFFEIKSLIIRNLMSPKLARNGRP